LAKYIASARSRLRRQQQLRATRAGVSHAPRLWKVWIAAPLAIVIASAFGWLLYQQVLVSPAVKGAAPIEVVKVTLTLMAALAAVLTGVYAYRKQRLSEGDAARADADLLSQRYSTAAEQLGHDKSAVRLAGVYAMARLADDWQKQRQQCIDVLCAYLRMPSEHDVGPSEGEIRATIVRTIAAHLRDHSPISWSQNDFDFSDAALHNANFDGVTFSGRETSFTKATFSGERTSFDGATFSGERTSFDGATLLGEQTSFSYARFSGDRTSFNGTTFSAKVTSFFDTTFSGGRTSFCWANFSKGANFNSATFSGATEFDGAMFAGSIFFYQATFSGGVSFAGATFSGTEICFRETTFSKSTEFYMATFSGATEFDGATFSGERIGFITATFSGEPTSFTKATFSGEHTCFTGATFSGERTSFDGATFSGEGTTFDEATFSGGTTADKATAEASFVGGTVHWGPITPRPLPSLAAAG
jgi:uncharacterized protein YjbI with pentapeptide repeats